MVVAVSGGADSVGLLRALHGVAPELGLALSVAHLDHGVRGEAAREDARFVSDLADALGLPIDLGEWSPSGPGGFEAAARAARYAWLVEVARRRGASLVAVGHNRDDQAETVLHRVLRGTGPRGLAGIPRRRRLAPGIDLIRPLLGVSRAEVREWLVAIGQPWREDASNADTERTRAKIRHDLLPRLAAEYNPRVVEALARLALLASAADRSANRAAAAVLASSAPEIGPDGVVLRREALTTLPIAARCEVLRLAWRRAGWPERAMSAGRWLRLAHLASRERGRLAIGRGIEAVAEGDALRLERGPREEGAGSAVPPPTALPVPGSVAWGTVRLSATIAAGADIGGAVERIDLDALDLDPASPALTIRGARPGDRFAPLGMAGRSMTLADFLRGRGVPRDERAKVPVALDRSGIVWVVGRRIADRVRVSGSTTRAVVLRRDPAGPTAATPEDRGRVDGPCPPQ